MWVVAPKPEINENEIIALRLLRSCPKTCTNGSITSDEFETICQFRRTLSNVARKPLSLSPANFPKITCDERCILTLLAAAKNDDHRTIHMSLEWMVHRWAKSHVAKLVMEVNQILERMNINLNVPNANRPVRREEPGLYQVIG